MTKNSALAETTGSRRKSRFAMSLPLAACRSARLRLGGCTLVLLRLSSPSSRPGVMNGAVLADARYDRLERRSVFVGEPVRAGGQEAGAPPPRFQHRDELTEVFAVNVRG